MSSFSFKFSQTREKIQLKIGGEAEGRESPERDYVKDVDADKGIRSLKERKKEAELLIPCIPGSLEARAVQELLAESKAALLENPDDRDLAIYQASVEKAGQVSTLEDYDNIPVEKFGMAMLKGMGWTSDKGIKGKVINCLDPVIRPKGLGLGASLPKQQKEAGKKDDKDDLVMKKGAYVKVTKGTLKDKYGVVDGFDEDTGRAIVKMALGREIESISENILFLVTKREYKDFGKIINKNQYEKFKSKDVEEKIPRDDRPFPKETRDRSRSPNHRKEKHYSRKEDSPPPIRKSSAWLRPYLRVRYLNEKYKNGKYFNSKMVIQDVTTPTTCVIRSENDGRIIEDVNSDDLETVIPKSSSLQIVMIINNEGSAKKGTLASILKKDKDKCRAVVQSLQEKKDVWTLNYDDVCEYVGDVSDYL